MPSTNQPPKDTNRRANFGNVRAMLRCPFGKRWSFCRHCHKLSPFCFYNGNTFAAIGRTMVQDILRKIAAGQGACVSQRGGALHRRNGRR